MWMVCGSNTPPDEGCQLPPPWRFSALPTHTQKLGSLKKQFVLALQDPILLEVHDLSAQKLVVTKPGPSPVKHLRISARRLLSALGLKAIASQFEKQLAHHAHFTINLHCAAHSENYVNCVNCGTTNLLGDSFTSLGTTTNSLRDLFRWSPSTVQESSALFRQNCCWRFTPACITSSRFSTFPDSLRDSVPSEHLTL